MTIKTYLDKLRHILEDNNYPDFYDALEEVNSIIWDRREMGESDKEIVSYLGSPEKLAKKLMSHKENIEEFSENVDSFSLANVEIHVKNIDVNVVSTDSKRITVTASKSFCVEIKRNKNSIKIKQLKNRTLFDVISSFGLTVTIGVPENIILEKLEITNESKNTLISGVEIVDLDLKVNSGDIKIKNSRIYTANIDNVSGDIEIKDSTIHDLRAENITGDVEMREFNGKKTMIRNESGDVDINGIRSDYIDVHCVSGDVDVMVNASEKDYHVALKDEDEFDEYNDYESKSLFLTSTSGDVDYHFYN